MGTAAVPSGFTPLLFALPGPLALSLHLLLRGLELDPVAEPEAVAVHLPELGVDKALCVL
jgi:hypothetical protein